MSPRLDHIADIGIEKVWDRCATVDSTATAVPWRPNRSVSRRMRLQTSCTARIARSPAAWPYNADPILYSWVRNRYTPW